MGQVIGGCGVCELDTSQEWIQLIDFSWATIRDPACKSMSNTCQFTFSNFKKFDFMFFIFAWLTFPFISILCVILPTHPLPTKRSGPNWQGIWKYFFYPGKQGICSMLLFFVFLHQQKIVPTMWEGGGVITDQCPRLKLEQHKLLQSENKSDLHSQLYIFLFK